MTFLTICLNPTLQKTFVIPRLEIGNVNRVSKQRVDASGKGINVTRVLQQLGGDAVHLTHLGGDHSPFLRLLVQDKIMVQWEDSASPIRGCYTLLDQTGNSVTEIVEEAIAVEKGTEERIRNLFSKLVYQTDWVIISGSRADGYSKELYADFVKTAKNLGKKVILDYRGKDLLLSLPYRPDYIKPNIDEFWKTFLGAVDRASLKPGEMKKMLRRTMIDLNREHKTIPIITQGDGPVLYLDEGKMKRQDVPKVRSVNTIGCGDAFTAGLAYSLAAGRPLKEAVLKGIDCGAANAALLRPGVIQ